MYRLPTVVAAAALVAMPALADVPGRGWMSAAKVRALIAKRGAKVVKLEADDGHWEGDAVQRGRRYEFHVDPHSGAITKWESDRD